MNFWSALTSAVIFTASSLPSLFLFSFTFWPSSVTPRYFASTW